MFRKYACPTRVLKCLLTEIVSSQNLIFHACAIISMIALSIFFCLTNFIETFLLPVDFQKAQFSLKLCICRLGVDSYSTVNNVNMYYANTSAILFKFNFSKKTSSSMGIYFTCRNISTSMSINYTFFLSNIPIFIVVKILHKAIICDSS